MPVGGALPPGVRAYSLDLRERVVAAVDAGMSQSQAAARLGGVAADRGALPGPPAGDRQPGSDPAAARPGADGAPAAAGRAAGPPGRRRGCHAGRARGGVRRRRRPAGVAGVDVAGDRRPAARAGGGADPGRAPAGGAAVEAKSLSATERDETARARWRTDMAQIDPSRVVFVDECGTHTSMTRRRARAPRGTRARGAVPRNRGPVTTLLAGLSLTGMSPAMTVEGGTTAAGFAAYLEQVL